MALLLGDFVLTSLAGFSALGLWSFTRQEPLWADLEEYAPWVPLASFFWVLLLWVFDLYKPVFALRISSLVQRYLGVSAVSLLLYLVLFFFAPRNVLPRLPLLYFLFLAFALGIAWRWTLVCSVAKTAFQQRLLIIGAGVSGKALVQVLREEKAEEFVVVGFVDDDLAKQRGKVLGIPVLGAVRATVEIAKENQVDTVVYSALFHLRAEVFKVLLECQTAGLSVIPMATLYEAVTERVPVQHVAKEWLLPTDLTGGQSSLSYRVFVWIVDHLFCVLGGAFLLLVGPLAALAIKLDSPGPVFYRQVRLGLGGAPFPVLKFRSMVRDAEELKGPQWATGDDPRITRVGRVLRKTRLDELPQIVNILKGHLHLIGPRPERPEFFHQLEREIPFYGVRLAVKPGLTGWAQIRFRYGSSVEETLIKLQYDLYYIKNRSPLLDLKILLHTVWKVVSFSGR